MKTNGVLLRASEWPPFHFEVALATEGPFQRPCCRHPGRAGRRPSKPACRFRGRPPRRRPWPCRFHKVVLPRHQRLLNRVWIVILVEHAAAVIATGDVDRQPRFCRRGIQHRAAVAGEQCVPRPLVAVRAPFGRGVVWVEVDPVDYLQGSVIILRVSKCAIEISHFSAFGVTLSRQIQSVLSFSSSTAAFLGCHPAGLNLAHLPCVGGAFQNSPLSSPIKYATSQSPANWIAATATTFG